MDKVNQYRLARLIGEWVGEQINNETISYLEEIVEALEIDDEEEKVDIYHTKDVLLWHQDDIYSIALYQYLTLEEATPANLQRAINEKLQEQMAEYGYIDEYLREQYINSQADYTWTLLLPYEKKVIADFGKSLSQLNSDDIKVLEISGRHYLEAC